MRKIVRLFLATAVLAASLSVAGCTRKVPAADPAAGPGQPVAHKTPYYIVGPDGQRQYYQSLEDVKIALARAERIERANRTTTQP